MIAHRRNIKSIVLVICLLMAAFHADAQPGIRIAAGAADIIFLNEGQVPYLGYETNFIEHNFPLPSFQLGAIHQLSVSRRLDFNTGILFSQQGLDYSSSYLYDDITFRLNISYLKIPLLLKMDTDSKNDKKSGLYIGPYAAGMLKATLVTEVQGIKVSERMDNVSRFDLGGIIGYSWDIGRVPGHMFIDFRCDYSLKNSMQVIEGSVPRYLGPDKEYARNMSILLAFEYII